MVILSIAVMLPYVPVLAGFVPFPADIVNSFPPWEGTPAASCCKGFQHGQMGDLATQFYPLRATFNSKLRPGNAPLWNFQIFMGTPYQAMPQSALFFPLNWVFSIFNAPFAWSVLFLVRPVIVAVTTAIFVRRLGTSPPAALLSGFIFALSGWITVTEGRSVADTAMWMPLIFLAIDELRSNVSRFSVALGAAAFALPVLGGHPEVAFHVTLASLLYAVYRLFPLDAPVRRYAIGFVIAAILSMSLAAVQLLPTLEWTTLISRSLSMRWGSLRGSHIVGLFSRDLLHHPNIDGVYIPEGAAYCGAFTIALVPFVVFCRKRRDVIFFAVLAFFCIEVAYGWQPGFWISEHVPVLDGLPNWRLLVIADFALAVLAGLAITALERHCAQPENPSKAARSAVWLVAGAVAAVLLLLRLFGQSLPYGWNLLLLLFSFIIILMAYLRRIHASDLLYTALLISIVDLMTATTGEIPFVKPADIFPRTPVFDFLSERANPMWRISALDMVFGAQFQLPYGLSSPEGYDFANKRFARFFSLFQTEFNLKSAPVLGAPKGVVDLTGTRYFVTTDWNLSTSRFAALPNRFHPVFSNRHVQVFENPDAIPLVSFLPAAAVQTSANEDDEFAAITSPNFDARRIVILPEKIDRFWGERGPTAAASIADVTKRNDEVRLSVSADQDGVVYFNESYYPGWVAHVDEVEAPVIRANYAFMAIPVTRGRHHVRFAFEPKSFRIGIAITGFTILLIVSILTLPAAIRRFGRAQVVSSVELS
jgi:hypothetical protein